MSDLRAAHDALRVAVSEHVDACLSGHPRGTRETVERRIDSLIIAACDHGRAEGAAILARRARDVTPGVPRESSLGRALRGLPSTDEAPAPARPVMVDHAESEG